MTDRRRRVSVVKRGPCSRPRFYSRGGALVAFLNSIPPASDPPEIQLFDVGYTSADAVTYARHEVSVRVCCQDSIRHETDSDESRLRRRAHRERMQQAAQHPAHRRRGDRAWTFAPALADILKDTIIDRLRCCPGCARFFVTKHDSRWHCSGRCRPRRDRAKYMRDYRQLPAVKRRA